MHVVIVSDFGDVNGGAAQVAITSARGLADAGLDVTFVCAIPPVSALLNQPRIAVHCLGFKSVWDRGGALAVAQGIWNRRARRALEDILALLPRDETVVHFHQWTKALSPSVLTAPFRCGLPAIASLHDYFIACPNGAYYRFPERRPCQLTPMSPACIAAHCDSRSYAHKLVRVARQYATDRALARVGASLSVLSVSPFAEQVIAQFVPERHPRFVVGSSIGVARDAPVPVSSNSEFMFVGRLTEEKGVLPLAHLARDMGLPLTIVGDGPLRAELEQIGGLVQCAGWLGETSSPDASHVRGLSCFPRHGTRPEASLSWKHLRAGYRRSSVERRPPLISSPTDSTAMWWKPAIGPELSARMLDLLDNDVARKLGTAAYSHYWNDPQTPDRHTRNLLAVYRSVLSQHNARLLESGAHRQRHDVLGVRT